MSLDFDVSAIKNYEVVTTLVTEDGVKKWHPVTRNLTFACMAVDLSGITAENWQDFYNRINIWETLVSEARSRDLITPLEVYSHIGLRTNVSNKTFAQFMAKVKEVRERDLTRFLTNTPEKYEKTKLATVDMNTYQELMRNGFHNEQTFDEIMTNPLWTDENITSCEVAD
jgi:hypothetical protein